MTDWRDKLNTIWGRDLSGQRLTLAEALLGGEPEKRAAALKPAGIPRVALKDKEFTELDDSEVDYEFGSPNRFFGTHANLVPLVSAVQGQRPFYGARFYNQALPLVNAEAPLVQNLVDGDPDGRSFDDLLGETAGAVRAKLAGKVLKVTPDAIELEGEDGQPHTVDLYHAFPFNRKSAVSNVAVVKPGDLVQPRQLLAKSNYTDEHGTLAMGLNARVGLVPYLGHTMDDAVVISESMAKRLTSEQLVGHDLDYHRGVKGGKAHYAGVFPKQFINDQLKKLDDDGVVLPGQTVMPGDPLILATRPRVISSQAAQLGQLSKHMRNARSSAAVLWDHEDPGVVTDVAKVKGGVKVNVSFQSPTKVSDKIVLRSGQKSFHPDTEVLTERGWIKIPELLALDRVASLFDVAPASFTPGACGKRTRAPQNLVARFERPLGGYSYHFTGELYGLSAQYAAYLVTGQHRIWRKGHTAGCSHWSCQDAQTIHGTSQSFMLSAPFDLGDRNEPVEFVIDQATHGKTGLDMDCLCRFPFRTWVRFMAMYLAEGNVRHSRPVSHEIVITQKEKLFCREIEAVLDGMGLSWRKVNDQYVTAPNKALRRYLDQFGKAADKHVPDEIKHSPTEVVRLFLDTIWMCDGDKLEGRRYYTSSARLSDDIQHLLALVGTGSITHSRPARSHQNHDSYTVQKLDYATVGTRDNYKKAFYRQAYSGPVHCLQVPGVGVILTRFQGRIMWNGNSIVSHIIPDEHMPRLAATGQPLEVLLNPLGLPSRVNASLPYELLLGKLARLTGKPYKLPAFNQKDENWFDQVKAELDKHGVSDREEVFDPKFNRKLEQPIMVGEGYIQKLHHTGESKSSARGQGSYSADMAPSHGGGDAAKSKRLSGLESYGLLSAGAYHLLRDGATVRGTKNDDYWSRIRQGHDAPEPGSPFVWQKFQALLNGAGYATRDLPDGEQRLQMWSDKDLDRHQPLEVKTGDIVDLGSLEPVAGGLFDPALTGANKWGSITLPFKVPNPAAHDMLRKLLGLTEKDFRAMLAGQMELPARLRARMETTQQ